MACIHEFMGPTEFWQPVVNAHVLNILVSGGDRFCEAPPGRRSGDSVITAGGRDLPGAGIGGGGNAWEHMDFCCCFMTTTTLYFDLSNRQNLPTQPTATQQNQPHVITRNLRMYGTSSSQASKSNSTYFSSSSYASNGLKHAWRYRGVVALSRPSLPLTYTKAF